MILQVQVVGDFNPTAACVQACAGLSAGAFAFSARAMNVASALHVRVWGFWGWGVGFRVLGFRVNGLGV